MTLDATAKESNLRASLKKFLIDNIYTVEGIKLSFDKGLAVPKVQGVSAVESWVAVSFGEIMMENLATHIVEIFVCTRQDKEGYLLTQMRDTVLGYLTDSTQDDGTRRIPLYDSSAGQPWSQIGGIVVHLEPETPQMVAEDGTKYKTIPVRLRWGVKI